MWLLAGCMRLALAGSPKSRSSDRFPPDQVEQLVALTAATRLFVLSFRIFLPTLSYFIVFFQYVMKHRWQTCAKLNTTCGTIQCEYGQIPVSYVPRRSPLDGEAVYPVSPRKHWTIFGVIRSCREAFHQDGARVEPLSPYQQLFTAQVHLLTRGYHSHDFRGNLTDIACHLL